MFTECYRKQAAIHVKKVTVQRRYVHRYLLHYDYDRWLHLLRLRNEDHILALCDR